MYLPCQMILQSFTKTLSKCFQAIIVFLITIHVYAHEKSEMLEMSILALSGCIWLQAFLVLLETKYGMFISTVFCTN